VKHAILLAAIFSLLFVNGCAIKSNNLSYVRTMPDGTREEHTLRTTVKAAWPASTEVSKSKDGVSSKGALSSGSDSISQEAGGTNVVDALKALDSILSKIKP
jgi:hypothetical protein